MVFDCRLNKFAVMYVERITILTLMKLLEISIVASNCFGLSRSCNIALSFFPFLAFIESRSEGESEKNAVSDPEINPDKNNNTITNNSATITSMVNPNKICPEIIFNKFVKKSTSMSSKMISYVNIDYPAKLLRKAMLVNQPIDI